MGVSAAILAGGHATRFHGRDKGALLVDGRTIRERQLAELQILTDDIMVVGRDTVAAARSVADALPDCGPLGGLHAALTEARHATTVVVACDMPYISAALLAYLASLTRDADAVVPLSNRGYHPLCAAYTRACLPSLTKRLAGRQLKMRDWLDDVRLRVVEGSMLDQFGDPNRLLANVNSPAEYEAAIQGYER